MPRSRNKHIDVKVSTQTWNKLQPIILRRGMSAEALCEFYLQSLVTATERNHALGLQSAMPFGKYQGMILETIIRAEPKYVSWLVAESQNFRLDPDALELLAAIMETEDQK